MKIKDIALIILGVLIIAGVVYVSYFFKKPEAPVTPAESQETQITEQKISDSTKPFKIDITYPQISGQDKFNKEISDFVDKTLNDFKTNSLENDNAVKEVDPEAYAKYPREYSLNIGYQKGQIDENVISIVMDVYQFEGGAHGSDVTTSFNFNPKTQSDITLADLFPNQPDYLTKISEFCTKDLSLQMQKNGAGDMSNSDWLKTGAGPNLENYKTFAISKDKIKFYFQQYQVAAYAAGSFTVDMPR